MTQIYLDYAATTPLDSRVLDVMLPFFRASFGNPSSVHRYGQHAEAAVEEARETVAAVLGCRPDEVIFTSCGSESDNLALRGAAQAISEKTGRKWILTARTEHHAVSKTAEQLAEHLGFKLEWLEVDEHGMVTPGVVEKRSCDNTAIVSVMYANNEIGTINPVAQIAEVCHRYGALFHTDAVQAAAFLPVDVNELGADLVSLGGHKFYGPKGVGALYVRQGTPLLPHLTGGGQEFGLRAGTSNVPYIVGFAEAMRLAAEEREQRIAHVKPLRDRIIGTVLEEIPDSRLTGHPEARLPNHASFAFKMWTATCFYKCWMRPGSPAPPALPARRATPSPAKSCPRSGFRASGGWGPCASRSAAGRRWKMWGHFYRCCQGWWRELES
jgi:cysteine desulfurase